MRTYYLNRDDRSCRAIDFEDTMRSVVGQMGGAIGVGAIAVEEGRGRSPLMKL